MRLVDEQRALAALIAGEEVAQDDAHVRAVARSVGLDVLRWTALSWRTLNVERGCPLTSALLRLRGRLEEAVAGFAAGRSVTPYADELGPAFLRFVAAEDPDPLVRATAALEEALVARMRGADAVRTVAWPQDPWPVLRALLAGEDPPAGGVPHEVVVDGSPPVGFSARTARPPG